VPYGSLECDPQEARVDHGMLLISSRLVTQKNRLLSFEFW
jgi:hypothetical protein